MWQPIGWRADPRRRMMLAKRQVVVSAAVARCTQLTGDANLQWTEAGLQPGDRTSTRRTVMKFPTMSLMLAGSFIQSAMAQSASSSITEEAARAIGVDAYLYFYPLISVDITRKQSTNIAAGKEFGKGPMNMFVNIPAFPPADLKVLVRIN